MSNRVVDTELSRERATLWLIALVLFGVFGYVLFRYIGTFVLGLFLYYVTRPVHARFRSRFESRTLTATLAIVSVAVPVLLLVIWTLVVVIRAIRDFAGTETLDSVIGISFIPDPASILQTSEVTLRTLLSNPSGVLNGALGQSALALLGTIAGSVAIALNAGLHLFIVLVIVFFLLRDDYRIAGWARSTIIREGGVFETFFEAVDRDLMQVYFGNILNAVLTGALGAVTYTVLNFFAPESVSIPEAALFGLLAGVASLIPVVGIKLVWVPLALVLFADAALTDPSALWFPIAFAAVSVVIVDTIPDQVLRPYVSGRSLHIGAVMLAYTFGPLLFGWYGVFLGPLLLVVIVECARHIVPALVGGHDEVVVGVEETADESLPKGTPAPGGVNLDAASDVREGADDRGASG
ncbi:AI-2E family transporter [Haloferax namakaokahaiae]|uniref:AI-2E family transporter n=1 Tax=Haloferax namakaokahaiae TaxID=1748331 RepID=A0ABD5ZD17_9EURY